MYNAHPFFSLKNFGKNVHTIHGKIEVKCLEDNIGEKLHDIWFGNDLLDMTPKAQTTKEKIDKLNYLQI